MYYMLPATLSSFAFVLPVANPSNSLAYAAGKVTIADMASLSCYLPTCIVPYYKRIIFCAAKVVIGMISFWDDQLIVEAQPH